MKQFIVFAGTNYYPRGGVDDIVASFDSAEDAESWVAEQTKEAEYEWQWSEILDCASGEWTRTRREISGFSWKNVETETGKVDL